MLISIYFFPRWYDGFSTFYVGSDGLIHKHVADKVMPDQDETPATKDQSAVAAKLALFLGLLIPGGETMSGIYPMTMSSSRQDFQGVRQSLLDTDVLEKLK